MSTPFPKLQEATDKLFVAPKKGDDALYDLGRELLDYINPTDYSSANYPAPFTATKKTKDLVGIVQTMMERDRASIKAILDWVVKTAEHTEALQAGNCQEKTFLAFSLCLQKLMDCGLSTYERTIPMQLIFCDGKEGHFFMELGDRWIIDPWAQLLFPREKLATVIALDTEKSVFDGALTPYFYIRANWQCFTYQKESWRCDDASTRFTLEIAPPSPSIKTAGTKRDREEVLSKSTHCFFCHQARDEAGTVAKTASAEGAAAGGGAIAAVSNPETKVGPSAAKVKRT